MLSESKAKRKWLDSVRDAIREQGLQENGWTVRGMPSERKAKRKWLDSARDAIREQG